MRKTIMDVSRWQGTIDWNTVKASGKVDGVMIRALGSKGSKPYVDPTFEVNYAGATAAGLPVGVYYYTTARTKAQADAELAMLRKALAGKALGLPVAVDVEDNTLTALGKQALTDLTAYALGVIQSWGVYAMLYTYLSFAASRLYMGGAALKPYDVWLAAYRKDKPAPGWAFGMWQYTSQGKLPGISGPVDLSHAYKDYAGIIRRAGLGQVRG